MAMDFHQRYATAYPNGVVIWGITRQPGNRYLDLEAEKFSMVDVVYRGEETALSLDNSWMPLETSLEPTLFINEKVWGFSVDFDFPTNHDRWPGATICLKDNTYWDCDSESWFTIE